MSIENVSYYIISNYLDYAPVNKKSDVIKHHKFYTGLITRLVDDGKILIRDIEEQYKCTERVLNEYISCELSKSGSRVKLPRIELSDSIRSRPGTPIKTTR